MTCASVTSAVVAIGNLDFCPIAQLAERAAVNRMVGGSSPSGAAYAQGYYLVTVNHHRETGCLFRRAEFGVENYYTTVYNVVSFGEIPTLSRFFNFQEKEKKMERQFFVNFQESGKDYTEVVIAESGNQALRKFFAKIGNRRIVDIITVVDGASGELSYANG